jgi:hypothetical protein
MGIHITNAMAELASTFIVTVSKMCGHFAVHATLYIFAC